MSTPLDPAAGDACHPLPRIDRREVTDVFRVMLQVEPGAEPNLQDLAAPPRRAPPCGAARCGDSACSSRRAGGRRGGSRCPSVSFVP